MRRDHQPGYHRLYLDRYNAWVEYTATGRAALSRELHEGEQGKLLVDVEAARWATVR